MPLLTPFGNQSKDDAMFEIDPSAKTDLKPGTLYAIAGEEGWIYYGRVAADKVIEFFRRRDRHVAAVDDIITEPVMTAVAVVHPSIGRALRAGLWKKLGRAPLAKSVDPRMIVQWPVGALKVSVWRGDTLSHETMVHDPAIQDMEIIAAWDAEHHIPKRLTADFGAEPAEWHIGGPIWRERRFKEELARRFPEQRRLPPDWVSTND